MAKEQHSSAASSMPRTTTTVAGRRPRSPALIVTVAYALVCCPLATSFVPSNRPSRFRITSFPQMVSIPLDSSSTDSFEGKPSADAKLRQKRGVRKKYKRKREKPLTEQASDRLRILRQAKYEELQKKSSGNPSIFSFESLFPAPVWDEASIQKDLYEIANRDKAVVERNQKEPKPKVRSAMRSSSIGGSSMMRVWRDPKLSSPLLSYDEVAVSIPQSDIVGEESVMPIVKSDLNISDKAGEQEIGSGLANRQSTAEAPAVDRALTRMVEDRVYGFRRSQSGEFEYDTSLMGDGAVKFRDGVRLGNPLKVNADILNYQAKKEFAKGRLEEAEELYEKALELDPRDGRSYLGLSRIAQRRRDFKLAKDYLRAGISRSVSLIKGEKLDRGPNPFLLQALGCLEERMGNLAQAEALFISAVKSRSSHAAAWVSLAQLRTRKLRQSASAGRVCFQSAERELELAGCPPSSHVYTAWASLEYKKAGDARRARELFEKALKCDPKCSPAWLQLGVLEADNENWDRAQECFENVLRFDQRNSRVLQAYAIMETKRPVGDSRKAIDLFERALRANPRDAGVLQAYALYVAKLGDIDAARNLLRSGTEVNKRHAPVWQAWGVLETRYGAADEARGIFQQGIWSCAQVVGGQSGGYNCARLWQAWGVLEAREGDHAAARRCFSRALDADNRNIAAIVAWTQMEQDLGNVVDARSIFERALKQLPAASNDKMAIWRSYEQMEKNAGNTSEALQVYQRSMREAMIVHDDVDDDVVSGEVDDGKQAEVATSATKEQRIDDVLQQSEEVEVERWNAESMRGEVWMNNGSIEGKLPKAAMKRAKQNKRGMALNSFSNTR